MLTWWDDKDQPHNWWLGQSSPDMPRVTKLQADGDELYMIQQVMAASSGEIKSIVYAKQSGFSQLHPHCPKCHSHRMHCINGHAWSIPEED